MGIRVKLDEDLSASVGAPLVESGHEVATVVAQGWTGLSDDELWDRLQADRELLVTADKGFGDLRRYPPGSHAGILLLRPQRESIVEYRGLVAMVVAQHQLQDLVGCIAVASPKGVRIRRGA